MQRTKEQGNVDGKFIDRDVNDQTVNKTYGTFINAEFMNDVQEEVCNVIEDAGIRLNRKIHNQFTTAVEKVIDETISTLETGVISVNGKKGDVVLYPADLNLGNVQNLSKIQLLHNTDMKGMCYVPNIDAQSPTNQLVNTQSVQYEMLPKVVSVDFFSNISSGTNNLWISTKCNVKLDRILSGYLYFKVYNPVIGKGKSYLEKVKIDKDGEVVVTIKLGINENGITFEDYLIAQVYATDEYQVTFSEPISFLLYSPSPNSVKRNLSAVYTKHNQLKVEGNTGNIKLSNDGFIQSIEDSSLLTKDIPYFFPKLNRVEINAFLKPISRSVNFEVLDTNKFVVYSNQFNTNSFDKTNIYEVLFNNNTSHTIKNISLEDYISANELNFVKSSTKFPYDTKGQIPNSIAMDDNYKVVVSCGDNKTFFTDNIKKTGLIFNEIPFPSNNEIKLVGNIKGKFFVLTEDDVFILNDNNQWEFFKDEKLLEEFTKVNIIRYEVINSHGIFYTDEKIVVIDQLGSILLKLDLEEYEIIDIDNSSFVGYVNIIIVNKITDQMMLLRNNIAGDYTSLKAYNLDTKLLESFVRLFTSSNNNLYVLYASSGKLIMKYIKIGIDDEIELKDVKIDDDVNIYNPVNCLYSYNNLYIVTGTDYLCLKEDTSPTNFTIISQTNGDIGDISHLTRSISGGDVHLLYSEFSSLTNVDEIVWLGTSQVYSGVKMTIETNADSSTKIDKSDTFYLVPKMISDISIQSRTYFDSTDYMYKYPTSGGELTLDLNVFAEHKYIVNSVINFDGNDMEEINQFRCIVSPLLNITSLNFMGENPNKFAKESLVGETDQSVNRLIVDQVNNRVVTSSDYVTKSLFNLATDKAKTFGAEIIVRPYWVTTYIKSLSNRLELYFSTDTMNIYEILANDKYIYVSNNKKYQLKQVSLKNSSIELINVSESVNYYKLTLPSSSILSELPDEIALGGMIVKYLAEGKVLSDDDVDFNKFKIPATTDFTSQVTKVSLKPMSDIKYHFELLDDMSSQLIGKDIIVGLFSLPYETKVVNIKTFIKSDISYTPNGMEPEKNQQLIETKLIEGQIAQWGDEEDIKKMKEERKEMLCIE